MQEYQGAVMIADITGFTALTEDLARQGPAGVELLTKCMNDYFSKIIETVHNGTPFIVLVRTHAWLQLNTQALENCESCFQVSPSIIVPTLKGNTCTVINDSISI